MESALGRRRDRERQGPRVVPGAPLRGRKRSVRGRNRPLPYGRLPPRAQQPLGRLTNARPNPSASRAPSRTCRRDRRPAKAASDRGGLPSCRVDGPVPHGSGAARFRGSRGTQGSARRRGGGEGVQIEDVRLRGHARAAGTHPGDDVLGRVRVVDQPQLDRPRAGGRPAADGWTTMTLAWSQASRQSEMRTGTSARSRAVCAAWSTPGTLGLPQQQSRHTTTRHGTGPPAVSSAGLSGTPRHFPPPGDPPRCRASRRPCVSAGPGAHLLPRTAVARPRSSCHHRWRPVTRPPCGRGSRGRCAREAPPSVRLP